MKTISKLKSELKLNDDMQNHRTFHERTGHMLEPNDSTLNTKLKDINKYVRDNLIKIDKNKTTVMLFNSSKKYDFFSHLKIENELVR